MPETPLDAATRAVRDLPWPDNDPASVARAAVIGFLRAKRALVDPHSPAWHVIKVLLDGLARDAPAPQPAVKPTLESFVVRTPENPHGLRFNVSRALPFGGSGATFQKPDKGK